MFPEPSHWGPLSQPWTLALLAEERSQSHVLDGQVGTEGLSAPLGQGVAAHPPSGGKSHSGADEGGCLAPGRVRLGAQQDLGVLGLRKASEGEGGARLRRHVETEVQAGLVAPLPGRSQEETRGTGLSPAVCIQAVCHGPSARPGPQPKEPH